MRFPLHVHGLTEARQFGLELHDESELLAQQRIHSIHVCHLRRFALVSLTNQPHLLRKHHSMRTTLRERHSTRGLRTAFTISIISWIWSLCALINAASAMPDVALPLAAPPAVPFASALPLSSSSTTGVVLPPPLSFDSTPLEGAGAGSEPSANASTHAQQQQQQKARGGSVRALRG